MRWSDGRNRNRLLADKANRAAHAQHDETMPPHMEHCRQARMSYNAMAKHFTEVRLPTATNARRSAR